jgi:hypothetical protein
LGHHGLLLQSLQRLAEAELCQRESVAILRRLVEVEKRSMLAYDLAIALSNHAESLQLLGRLADTERCRRECATILRQLTAMEKHSGIRDDLAIALSNHEEVLRALGQTGEAEQCRREAVLHRRPAPGDGAEDRAAAAPRKTAV